MKMKKLVIFFAMIFHSVFLSISGMNSGIPNTNKDTNKRTWWSVDLNEPPLSVPLNKKVKITQIDKNQTPLNNTLSVDQKIDCRWEGCFKTFDNFTQWKDHIKKEHLNSSKGDDNKFHCGWINNDCSKCSSAASQKSNLRIHLLKHIDIKPYKCTHNNCNKAFSYLSNRNRHLLTHTGKKPFKCKHPGCNKAFAQNGNLTTHMRTHTGKKPYKCDYPGCTWAFPSHGNLKEHKELHNTEKPFECDQCNKAFKRQRDLNSHLKTHSENKYPCSAPGCNRKFSHKTNLKTHMKTHEKK